MREYRAVFFDRDGTLSRGNQLLGKERNAYIGRIIGDSNFTITPDLNIKIFDRVRELYPELRDIDTVFKEERFWKKWYELILAEHGVNSYLVELAEDLYSRFPFHKMMEAYPETLEVLEYLKNNNYLIGVISDTYPSLEMSLNAMGIGHYFNSFICSSLVGVMKPDPKIFIAALESLGVCTQESIFIDDYKAEADGARQHGFTSFYLNRNRIDADFDNWEINNLVHVVDYLESLNS